MVVCGLSLHQGSTESRNTLEQKFILWLAPLPGKMNETCIVGKMELSCPLGITRCVPQDNSIFLINKSSRWLDIGLDLFFCLFMDFDLSRFIDTQKTNLAKNPASLVNNSYILTSRLVKKPI